MSALLALSSTLPLCLHGAHPVGDDLVRFFDLCYRHGMNLHESGWLKDWVAREFTAPERLFLWHGGLRPAGTPGAVDALVAPPGAPGVVPRPHHDRVVGTPPGLQAARDQPGPHERLHKRGQAPFRDDV